MNDEKNLEQLAVEQRRKYFKQWRDSHKAQVRKHQSDYWKRKAEKALAENSTQNNKESRY